MPGYNGISYVIDASTGQPRPHTIKSTNGVLSVDGSSMTQPISAVSLPLPVSAATSVNQSVANTALSAIETAVEGTLAISASSLPLPASASTAANQSTGNTALAAIKTAVEGTLTTTTSVNKTAASLSSAQSAAAGDFSSSQDVSNYRNAVVVGTHNPSSTQDNIEVWVSNDNSTFFKMGNVSAYPDGSDNSFSINLDLSFKYFKLKYLAAGTVTALSMVRN